VNPRHGDFDTAIIAAILLVDVLMLLALWGRP